jgi:uncharacterized protein (TIGR03083 family)
MLEALRDATDRMRQALEVTDPAAVPPACGGWSVEDVADHLGGVHLWAAASLGSTDFPGWEHPSRPRGTQPLPEWYAGCAATLLAALEEVGPSRPVWTFSDLDRTAAFWSRRQLHETTIHRVDVEQAAGRSHGTGIDGASAELAANGVEEVLTVLMPRTLVRHRRRPPEQVLPVPEPVALVCPDADRAWTVQLLEGRLVTRRGTDGAVATLTGPAAYTYLALWNRAPRDGFTVSGDQEAAARLLAAELTP